MVIINYTSTLPSNFTGVMNDSISKKFIKNGKMSRYYGPAIIWDNTIKFWWFNDKFYNRSDFDYDQNKFLKDIKRLWLL